MITYDETIVQEALRKERLNGDLEGGDNEEVFYENVPENIEE